MTGRAILLGVEHALFGAVNVRSTSDGSAAVGIAVGSDPSYVRWWSKGDRTVPNEDAVCVLDSGAFALVAVADAHFGHQASHDAIRAIADASVPESPAELEALVAELAARELPGGESVTTLAIAVVDRVAGTGFGVGFGDSTVAIVGAGGVDVRSTSDDDFVRPGAPATWDGAGRRFCFPLVPDALLVAFTDGVDNCGGHGRPGIGLAELRELAARTGPDAVSFARGLVEAALAGVPGSPGGHDNIAVAALGCTAPADTAPADTAPADTAPADTAPG